MSRWGVAAAAALTCIGFCGVAGAAALRGAGDAFGFSNRGTPVDLAGLTPEQRTVVRTAGFSDIRRLSRGPIVRRSGARGRFHWYAGSVGGAACFARGFVLVGQPEFRSRAALSPFGCEGRARVAGFLPLGAFPSRARPVADGSAFSYRFGSRDAWARVAHLCGLAADAVARIGIVRPNGRVLTTPIRGNTYCTERIGTTVLANFQARAMIGFDRAGRRLFLAEVPAPPIARKHRRGRR